MTHSICEIDEPDPGISYFENLFSKLLDPSDDLRTKLETVFRAETTEFDLPYAFLTQINQSKDVQYIQVAHGGHESLQAGCTAPLSESYCRKTIADPDGTKRINDAPNEGLSATPEYDRFGLDSYVGATIELDGEVYGTLCFASSEPRDEPITDQELTLLKLLAQWVSYELHTWGALSVPDAPGEKTGIEEELFTLETDRAFNMLCAPERRLILIHLLTGALENISEFPIATADPEEKRFELRHTHLPKLAAAGYVHWDQYTGDIEKGPQFTEVKPLLNFLTGAGS